MNEKSWIPITVAAIAAVATITAAWIGRSGGGDKGGTNSPETPIAAQVPRDQPIVPLRPAGAKPYEIIQVVREYAAFTDPETGLTFGVEEVYNESGSWFSPTLKGATITYKLPDGKSGYGGRDVGFRVDFMFRGRIFLMVIEAMDFKAHTVTIRIKEV
jgi:hypothetical protein